MKKTHYLQFRPEGNKIVVNPAIPPKDSVKVDMAKLPKAIPISYLKLNKETNQVVPMSFEERKGVLKYIDKAAKKDSQAKKSSKLIPAALFLAGVLTGAILVWQLFN